MLFYWICDICSWRMWETGLPKWINTITSSRWPWHFVPIPVIFLMLYRLLLSREQTCTRHCLCLSQTYTSVYMRHCPYTLLSVNPQSIFTVLWSDYSTSWLDIPFLAWHWKGAKAHSQGLILNTKSRKVQNGILLTGFWKSTCSYLFPY